MTLRGPRANDHARLVRPARTARAGSLALRDAQRARLLSAVLRVACKRGVKDASVTSVIAAAGVARNTFYECFTDVPACLLAASDNVIAQARAPIRAARDEHESWSERLRAGLAAALAILDEDPDLARLCVVELPSIGPAGLTRRSKLLAQFAAQIDEGRKLARGEPASVTAEAIAGGVLDVIHSRLLASPPSRLSELLNPLMSFIVMPYLGAEEARRELVRRPQPSPAQPPRATAPTDALAGLRMRLTGRTVSVIAAVAAEPGLSNRELSVRSGVADQGQMSKLLNRLEGLDLIENTAMGEPKGTSNAWSLSERGAQLARATRGARELGVR